MPDTHDAGPFRNDLRTHLVSAAAEAAEQWLTVRANRKMSDVNRKRLAGHVVNALWAEIERAAVEMAEFLAAEYPLDRAAREQGIKPITGPDDPRAPWNAPCSLTEEEGDSFDAALAELRADPTEPLPRITDGITAAGAEASAMFDLTIDEVRALKARAERAEGALVDVTDAYKSSMLIGVFLRVSGLTPAEAGRLFGVSANAVNAWNVGARMNAAHFARLDDLNGRAQRVESTTFYHRRAPIMTPRDGQPSIYQQWLAEAQTPPVDPSDEPAYFESAPTNHPTELEQP